MAGIVSLGNQNNRPLIVNQQTTTGASASDIAYGVSWDGNQDAPTKNAIYDKLSTMPDGSGAANRLTLWADTDTLTSDSAFIYDSTKDAIGIQVTDPLAALHIASATGTTINNVVSGSATLIAETLPTAPSGSTTLIAEPGAGGGGTLSFTDQGSGGFSLNDTDIVDIRVTACLLSPTDGIYYRSGSSEVISNTVSSGTDTYDLSGTAGAVTISGETTWYGFEYQVNGGGYTQLGIQSSNSYNFGGTASFSTTAWPTYYQNVPDTGPTAFTDGSASAQDIGSGAFSEVSGNILMEVDSVKTINSVDYVSGSPTGGNFDDTGLGTYNPEVAWTDNGDATNGIARVSQDGGSTWIYQYTGSSTSPYKFTSTSNDSNAEARWGQTYTPSSVVHNFAPYGTNTSPSSNLVYSSVGSTYSATLPADSVKYIVKHALTGGSSPYKILAPQASPAYGTTVSSSPYYDIGYTSWVTGVTVTPTSYGFSGTAQNRDYRVYSSASGIFSVTPLTLSTVSGSGSKYVSLSWSLPVGVTTVKILRQVNGGGYTVSKTVTGTSATDDSTDTSWSGNTTITPTSIVPLGIRIDKALSTITDNGQLSLVDVTGGSGICYQKISFGTATSSTAIPAYQAHITVASNTGYMDLVTGRIQINPSLGGATPNVILGDTNIINNASSSTIHFNVKGKNDSGLINTRSDYDTVFFGQTGGSDPSATVQIQPARSSDTALILRGHSSMTATTTMFRTITSAGSNGAEITLEGHIWAAQGSDANPGLSFRADADCGLRNVTTNTVSMVTGGTERTRWTSTGLSIGTGTGATARLTIAAGGTGANTAPIKFISGSLNATPEIGAVEFLTNKWYGVITTSTQRREFIMAPASLTSGRVPYADSIGGLQDVAGFTYSINRLSPTYITLGAGTATAGTCPLVMTSGTLLGTAIAGGIEFLTDKWYATITTGAARKELTLNDAALTSGRVPIVTTNGRLTDDSDLTFAADTLTCTKFAGALNGTVGATTPSSGVFTSLQADTITNDTGLAAGTYTPTLTGVANVSSTTSRQATYMRVGNTVTVAGQFDLTPTAVGLVSVAISLPVASNFSTAYQAGGVGHVTGALTGRGGAIEADSTNDRVQLDYYDDAGSADTVGYTFTYEVI